LKPEPFFLSTIEPFVNNNERWWDEEEEITDLSTLKPKPDHDILLIVGDGWNVMDDISKFLDFRVDHDLMCMNFSPKIIPKTWPIHHFIAGDSHTEEMQKVAGSLKAGTIRHCWNKKSINFDVRWSRNSSRQWTGTTLNLGVKIGIALGYMKIVLAGCPMDRGGNWYTKNLAISDVKKYKDHTAHLWKWTEIASRPIGRFIRSLSGNTADLFGTPDLDWLEDL
jgi:hypothetical protein